MKPGRLLYLLILSGNLLTAVAQQTRPVVVIDPGHGGTDPGAIGIQGIREKDITLKIALHLRALAAEDQNLDLYLTRYTDTLISLSARARLARILKADWFVSIHCNWANHPYARGTEAFVAFPGTGVDMYTRKSIALSIDLLDTMEDSSGFKNRGVKFAGFRVLNQTATHCPAVLLEIGFISNPEDLRRIAPYRIAQLIIRIIQEIDEKCIP
ncbi:N-acetylmuramoyl-L-alanine amidase family protein [Sinomicrobium soli]|uniref:N-acetylmuramoyl-L-alanine amidase family protein n=1 Tax=Sinomicrobium sp. N-1-3-6 TaxID=2219864 RepID=UPI000DCBF1FF|nr:N-acetylmuramoyl-L-alanine amidase [Sinomicrobium sp. N-1-3-6]RAV29222.1 N-acetylmuramoyl-L-alanine amidase [Sinomicrobium sp. N-1-3-6]